MTDFDLSTHAADPEPRDDELSIDVSYDLSKFENRHRFINTGTNSRLPTWQQWLTLPKRDLMIRFRCNPNGRKLVVGHERRFSSEWVATLGLWGHASSEEVLRIAPGRAGKLQQFKNFWKLKLRRCSQSAPPPGAQLRMAAAVHRAATLPKYHINSSYVDWETIAKGLGILPIEAVLYDIAMSTMLEAADMDFDVVCALPFDDRMELWQAFVGTISAHAFLTGGGMLDPWLRMSIERTPTSALPGYL